MMTNPTKMERRRALQDSLNDRINFIKSVEEIFNCHMVNFITGNLWDKHIPEPIKEEVAQLGEEKVLELIYHFGSCNSKLEVKMELTAPCPTLSKYLIACRQYYYDMTDPSINDEESIRSEILNDSSTSVSDADDNIKKRNLSSQYLTPAKKRHEVDVMSSFIAKMYEKKLANQGIIGAIVDIGGGKGYLGSALALRYGLRVLGIDVASDVTDAAKSRNDKICRKLSEKCSFYQQKTVFVTPNTDLGNLVKEFQFLWGSVTRVALVGLHTCGNLGASNIELFAATKTTDVPVTILCNVGCCYNLLDEKYLPEGVIDKAHYCLPPLLHGHSVDLPLDETSGFPMSDFLCQRQFWLGRNARNLASQSVERVMSQKKVAVDALFHRAVLQTVLLDYAENCSDTVQKKLLSKLDEMMVVGKGVGRVYKRNASLNLHEYLKTAFEKLDLDIQLPVEEVDKLSERYDCFKSKIKIFYLIRIFLAPVIESIILLDRLLYLLEKGINEAYLVRLFDPLISPRCFALVALK
ncbi:hypothetical protein J437_LFUL002165 [Ladona fulva]|uniref:Methyltransferase domain-containing protein n=1 Tax=Ladona fulva TaxID=123851 RepID=A0A8K0JYD1_LADFU|nr:hypothetical protein J437_LFUL002165 [Ladona fulva]